MARELCSQLSYGTHVTDYGALEKCYSIWVMVRNVPEEMQNSVSLIELKKRDLIGETPDEAENYDLLSVVFIRLGNEVPEDSVFEYIEGVNKGKTEVVKKYVDIESRPQIAEEVKTMEGFAEMFREEGMEEGMEQKRKEINDLNSWLIGQDRWEDLKRSTYDDAFQDDLFKEMYREREKVEALA